MASGTSGKTIELLHPIAHDGKVYSRGLHQLDEELAEAFLKLRDAVSKQPIARVPKPSVPVKGTVSDAPKK